MKRGEPRAERTQDVAPFHTPPGTTWDQVVIEFHNDEAVKVTVGSVVEHKSFADMGFVDRRKKAVEQADGLWVWLRLLAQYGGIITWEDNVDMSENQRTKLKKGISRIRDRLRAYFPDIPGDPFKPYRRVRAYETRFVLQWSDAYRRSHR